MEKDDEDDNEQRVGARVHPLCINASNPYHECVEYCFRKILEAQEQQADRNVSVAQENGDDVQPFPPDGGVIENWDSSGALHERTQDRHNEVEQAEKIGQDVNAENDGNVYANLTPKQKRLFDLRLKLNAARKANQKEIVAEKTREEAPKETRGVSKHKWFEERQKILKKQLESNGLDMSKAFMLDTQEAAEAKYKKWEKKPAPFGWDVFNQRSLYNAYKKRTKSIPYSAEDYAKAKEADPEFYRDGSSLQYGKAPDISEENVDKMVNELEERSRKRKEFSRRRKFHEEKDIDSINDRNEHFNRKIERAFGKYTVEIKNNLERGTALPD